MYYKRFITEKVEEALKNTPVVFINGPRQVGKSTLVQTEMHRKYFTLDDLSVLDVLKQDPFAFLGEPNALYTVDEVQRLPDLFLTLKFLIDKERIPGKFILTGSANVMLLPKVADSLAGRMEIFHLYPLAVNEINQTRSNFFEQMLASNPQFTPNATIDILHFILLGGYPEILQRKTDRRSAWFESYITAILQRDIREISNIEQLSKVPQLLKLLAARVSSLLNMDEISRSLGIPTTTLKRYYTLLETLFLVNRLPAFSDNLGKRVVKSSKLYFYDSGLLCYLLGLNREILEEDPHLFGHIFENFVIQELLKMSTWCKDRVKLYYYRDQSKVEVDLIIEMNNRDLIAIEIKSKKKVVYADAKGIEKFKSHPRFKRGFVLYLGNEIIPLSSKIDAVPISCLFPDK
ncbi:MAG: hypothetical protein S4CHLAM7_03630 [Chlamydiae bacterium]|nr:hypothetical protein [Chlamydiota bacterium]